MNSNGVFIGTVSGLANTLLSEYTAVKKFKTAQINFSPSEDITINKKHCCQTADGVTLSLSLCGRYDSQMENINFFGDECFNGFDKKSLRRGQVYQLTFIAAYKNNADAVEVFYPKISGKWASWEAYWKSNAPTEDCVIFAAVNLLEGIPPYDDKNGFEHCFRYERMPVFSESCIGDFVQYIGETNDLYTQGFYYIGLENGWVQINVQPQSNLNTIPVYRFTSQVPKPSDETESQVFLWAGSDMCTLIFESSWSAELYPGRVYYCKQYSAEEGYRWHDILDEQLKYKQNKSNFFSSITVSDWQEDSTYPDYPYKGVISLSDINSTMLPTVVFNITDAVSGNYAPVAECGDGIVTIYSKVNTAITIPTIKCEVTL